MKNHYESSLKRIERYSLIGAGLLSVCAMAASLVIQISGAVTANGFVAAKGQNITLQHPDGGHVVDVFVSNGDVIVEGQKVLSFDDTELLAESMRLKRAKLELQIKIERLSASLAGQSAFSYSTLRGRKGIVSETDRIISVQSAVLNAEQSKIKTEIEQAKTRAAGAAKSRLVLEQQRDTNVQRKNLIEEEIAALKPLIDDKLVPQNRMTRLQREKLDIQQRLQSITLEETQLQNSESDAINQASIVQKSYEDRLWKEKEAAEAELADISKKVDRLAAQLSRIDIIAPVGGRVHELSVTNAGAYVVPGDVVLQIVPTQAESQVRVRLNAADIDDVKVGQDARVRLDTYQHLNMPEFAGAIKAISPDRTIDEVTGLPYYSVIVEVTTEDKNKFKQINPEMGVPVSVLIETQQRSLANYLLSPVKKSFTGMFNEN